MVLTICQNRIVNFLKNNFIINNSKNDRQATLPPHRYYSSEKSVVTYKFQYSQPSIHLFNNYTIINHQPDNQLSPQIRLESTFPSCESSVSTHSLMHAQIGQRHLSGRREKLISSTTMTIIGSIVDFDIGCSGFSLVSCGLDSYVFFVHFLFAVLVRNESTMHVHLSNCSIIGLKWILNDNFIIARY